MVFPVLLSAQTQLMDTLRVITIKSKRDSQDVFVNDTLRVLRLRMTNGATANYVLTSDANGYATWQAVSGVSFPDSNRIAFKDKANTFQQNQTLNESLLFGDSTTSRNLIDAFNYNDSTFLAVYRQITGTDNYYLELRARDRLDGHASTIYAGLAATNKAADSTFARVQATANGGIYLAGRRITGGAYQVFTQAFNDSFGININGSREFDVNSTGTHVYGNASIGDSLVVGGAVGTVSGAKLSVLGTLGFLSGTSLYDNSGTLTTNNSFRSLTSIGVNYGSEFTTGLYLARTVPVTSDWDMTLLQGSTALLWNSSSVEYMRLAKSYGRSTLTIPGKISVDTLLSSGTTVMIDDTVRVLGFRMPNGAVGGYYLSTDASGFASWANIAAVGSSAGGWTLGANRVFTTTPSDSVNIRTSAGDTTGGGALFTNWGTSDLKGYVAMHNSLGVTGNVAVGSDITARDLTLSGRAYVDSISNLAGALVVPDSADVYGYFRVLGNTLVRDTVTVGAPGQAGALRIGDGGTPSSYGVMTFASGVFSLPALSLSGNLDMNSNDIVEVDSLSGRTSVWTGNVSVGGNLSLPGNIIASDGPIFIYEGVTIRDTAAAVTTLYVGNTGTGLGFLTIAQDTTNDIGYIGFNGTNAGTLRFYTAGTSNEQVLALSGTTLSGGAALVNILGNNIATTKLGRMGRPFQSLYALGVYDTTTADAANVVIQSTGRLVRSTSSRRYKTDIEPISAASLLRFDRVTPVHYTSKTDGKSYFGFTAEDIDKAGLRELVTYDAQGRPDAVQYGHMTALLLAKIRQLEARIEQLEDKQ